jgi:hypothetical protein
LHWQTPDWIDRLALALMGIILSWIDSFNQHMMAPCPVALMWIVVSPPPSPRIAVALQQTG